MADDPAAATASSPGAERGGDLADGRSMNKPNRPSGIFGRFTMLFGADIGSRALRFAGDVLLVRHFGQAAFGQLNLAQSLAVQGTWIATCGLNTAGVRSVAAEPATAQSIAATIVLLRISLAMITWALIAGLAWLVPQYRDSCQLAALYGLTLFTAAVNVGWVAQGLGKIQPIGLAMLVGHVIYLAGVQLIVWRDWPLTWVPLILVGAETLAGVFLWLWVVRNVGAISRPLPGPAARRFLWDALPIGGANLLRGIVPGSDILLLGLFVGKADLGQYSAALKLYALGAAVLAAYFGVLLPHLASRAAESDLGLGRLVGTSIRRSLLAAAPTTGVALLLAPGVLRLLFGPGFEHAERPLRILLAVLPVQLLLGHWRAALVVVGRQRSDLALVVIGAIAHLGAKLALVPAFGIAGAAWGNLAGECVLLLLAGYAVMTVFRRELAGGH